MLGLTDLYRKMYMIRKCEEEIIKIYPQDKMKTPMHMSMGEEGLVVGVCSNLREKDQVTGTFRSHALYLAKTEDIEDFFLEMYGKERALIQGYGGSMHLCKPSFGHMGSSGIVASGIPVAVGLAFANKYKDNENLVATFFGDGATNEGAFWESLNAACLYELPIIFVCEDNGLAVHTDKKLRNGYKSLENIVKQYNCSFRDITNDNVTAIRNSVFHEIEKMKVSKRPLFLYGQYHRCLEHVGIYEDYTAGYRAYDDFLAWKEHDPLVVARRTLIDYGLKDRVREAEILLDLRISRAIEAAEYAECSDVKCLEDRLL